MNMILKKYSIILAIVFFLFCPAMLVLSHAQGSGKILIPMDKSQSNHLKAYGIAYWSLSKNLTVDWLLNYRGGSFLCDYSELTIAECRIRGVSCETISSAKAAVIYSEVQSEASNMDVVRLEKIPKIAVYVPPSFQPWDDAVTMAMEYAEIPYDKIWDKEVLDGKLAKYDWLHLHHEDFTGQYGKFYSSFGNAAWYLQQVAMLEKTAAELGFKKVSKLKLAVAQKIKEYIGNGGFMFAMCSATDTYDIALAAQNTDICESIFDGDGASVNADKELDFSKTLAFENFSIELSPLVYEFSNIDVETGFGRSPEADVFSLFDFSAKHDPVPTMLTQCHTGMIGGFMGQTSGFHKRFIKKSIIVLAQKEGTDEVKYLTGNFGRGTFTFYGGHDPEDYQHAINDPPTDLALHKNSPGYRLILNNVLFPSARKKKQKT